MENSITLDMFAPLVNEMFTIDVTDGEPLALKLVEAKAKQLHPDDGRNGEKGKASTVRIDPFHLLFTSLPTQFLEQGTYALNHDATGRTPIFIVPIGRDEDGFTYQAVFG
ncbi:MAG: hypothetical protein ABIR47_18430 [Candidatus Kapaibacterium sp.]